MKYEWKYGENKYQRYYDVTVDGVYLLVFENKFSPGIWMGCYGNNMIYDKTFNDRQRKKVKKNECPNSLPLPSVRVLGSKDPEYMKKKVEWCYRHGLTEITP